MRISAGKKCHGRVRYGKTNVVLCRNVHNEAAWKKADRNGRRIWVKRYPKKRYRENRENGAYEENLIGQCLTLYCSKVKGLKTGFA